MKRLTCKIPFSQSHPLLFAKRQERIKAFSDDAGILVACLIGAPILAFIGGVFIFVLFAL